MKINLNYFNELLKHSISVERHASMAPYTKLKTGGRVAYLVLASTSEEIILTIQLATEFGINWKVVGQASSLIISDLGYFGVIVLLKTKFCHIKQQETMLTVQAGVSLRQLSFYAYQHQLSGLENGYSMYSSVGASVARYNNRKKFLLFEPAISCDYLDQQGQRKTTPFNSERLIIPSYSIILNVTFNLARANSYQIRTKMRTLYFQKLFQYPFNYPCIGPVFSELVEGNLLTLLHQCHCVGKRLFNVQVSEKHPNYILNLGHATSFQVEMLIEHIKTEVLNQTSVKLQCILEKVG